MKLQSLLAVCTFCTVYLCFVGWFIWRTVKKFGWEALWVKGAAFLDGAVILGSIISFIHRFEPVPHSILHYGIRAFDLGCLAGLSYVVLFDRPTPWLLKPPVKWTLYGLWLSFVAVNGIREGW
jgi:hypothetical protein